MSMTILVTGGAGYVGSHCVKLLHEQGHTVVVYDNLEHGNREAVPDDVEFVRGDLLDRSRLASLMADHRFDGVMHFAALLNVNESLQEPRRYYENNVLGSLNLIGEMRRCEIDRLVFSSTCAIYGTPPNLPIVEDMPKKPITPYGRTKLIVETALQDYASTDGLGSVSLRYFNASGAAADGSIGESRKDEYHLIPLVLEVALGQRPLIKIFGTDYPTPDGTAVRDYIHVEDLAWAHLKALECVQPGTASAYNVGTGNGVSVREIVDVCRKVTGAEIPVEESDRREGDPPALYADATQIRQALDWQPEYADIERVVASAWRWHSSHPHGF